MLRKQKITSTDRCREEAVINIDREEIERVTSFEHLGARIQANGKTTPEIRRRLAMATTKRGHENQGPKKAQFFLRQPTDVKHGPSIKQTANSLQLLR